MDFTEIERVFHYLVKAGVDPKSLQDYLEAVKKVDNYLAMNLVSLYLKKHPKYGNIELSLD